jgi:HD-GYP domain-containing protein (c-di-GMP phosphodiesterase class II)
MYILNNMSINFKIYIENKLENSVDIPSGGNQVNIFNRNNFRKLIEEHLASRISQSFLFITTKKTLLTIEKFMGSKSFLFYQYIIVGSDFKEMQDCPLELIQDYYPNKLTKDQVNWHILKFTQNLNAFNHRQHFSDAETRDMFHDQNELIRIGQLLSEERDRDNLIKKILLTSIKITGSDAGCVYLVLEKATGERDLLFKYSYTYSRNIDFNEFIMPLNEKSIAGFCALKDEVINIPDAYNIPKTATFSFNDSFDKKYDYMSRSMLVFPLKNHLGEMQGVIQLINSKENINQIEQGAEAYEILLETREDFLTKVYPFAVRYEDLMRSVAGQASIALDNIKMVKQLEDQFEGMVRASVDAIDSKDPATSGHSARVSKMGVRFLKLITSIDTPPYKELVFSDLDLKQMEYACLLHDYGKVYIDNDIFLKAKKLFPKDFKLLMLRLDLIAMTLRNNNADNKNLKNIVNILSIKEKIRSLNEPRVYQDNPRDVVDEIIKLSKEIVVYDSDGNLLPVLTPQEEENLLIPRGTLNPEERYVIESHVLYTHKFLKSIPWPKHLKKIPDIAGGHHEFLDGSGYPNGLKGDELLIESRIMAILDIFDALSASDRPYKDAVPYNKVKSIIYEEANKGKLDKSLVNLFFDNQIFEGLY